jgi:hypothetical protein
MGKYQKFTLFLSSVFICGFCHLLELNDRRAPSIEKGGAALWFVRTTANRLAACGLVALVKEPQAQRYLLLLSNRETDKFILFERKKGLANTLHQSFCL